MKARNPYVWLTLSVTTSVIAVMLLLLMLGVWNPGL